MALLLLLFLVEPANTHQCDRAAFPHCTNNNSVISVMKSTEMYQVTLRVTEWQCFNEFCLVNNQEYRQKTLMCNDICGACQQLQPLGSNGKSTERIHVHIVVNFLCVTHAECGTIVTNCEVQLDIYLDDFCAKTTSMRNRDTINASATIKEELQYQTSTITVHSVQLTTVTGKFNNIMDFFLALSLQSYY